MNILSKVLIIDPDANNRQMLSQLIFSLGFTVIEANSEKDALSKLRSVRPDLVLLSVSQKLPDHFEILDYLKYDSASHNLSVIV